MFKLNKPKPLLALVTLVAAAALSACGGGGSSGGGGGTAAAPPAAGGGVGGGSPSGDIPASALQSVDGFIAFMNTLVAGSSETDEPILLGDAALPVDDSRDAII